MNDSKISVKLFDRSFYSRKLGKANYLKVYFALLLLSLM